MVNEKVRFSFSSDCLTSASPSCSSFALLTNDELYQELNDLLAAFCSDAQQQFCVDQDILCMDDLKRMRHTVQQIQSLLPGNTLISNNGQPLQHTLARVIQEILNRYGEACYKRSMRLLDDLSTNQSIGDWHQLKQQWELKNKENQRLLLILDDIVLLTQSWHQQQKDHNNSTESRYKHLVLLPSLSSLPHRLSAATRRTSVGKREALTTSSSLLSFSLSSPTTAEDILTSILTTFDYPPGAYTVMIDKCNYRQLGLQQRKIGTRQIIFDSHQLSTSDMIAMINRLCDLFASSFATTAHHHLAQIDSQMKKAQPFYMMTQSMKKLSAEILDSTWSALGDEHMNIGGLDRYDKSGINEHGKSQSPSPSVTSSPPPLRSATTTNSMSVLTSFKLTHSASQTSWVHSTLPIPSFAPAPWQIPDLLKPRHPYNPAFFGLIRRKTHINIDSSISTLRNSSYTSRYQQSNFLKHAQQHETPIKTASSVQPPRKIGIPASDITTRRSSNNKHAPNTPASHISRHASSGTIYSSIDNNIMDPAYSSPIRPRESTTTAYSSQLHRNTHFDKSKRSTVPSMSTLSDRQHPSSTCIHHHHGDFDDDEDDDHGDHLKVDRVPTTPNRAAPFTSVSVEKLFFYLGRIAGQFYQDLLMHTQLRYQETQDTLQDMEGKMMDLYRHLQLASSRAVMHRAMMIVQELDERHQQHKQHDEQPHLYSPLSVPHNPNAIYIYQQDRKCGAQEDEESSSSSSSSSDDTSDSDSYEHNQQQATKATASQWRPICIDTYQQQQRDSPPSSIVLQDSKLYRKGAAINEQRSRQQRPTSPAKLAATST